MLTTSVVLIILAAVLGSSALVAAFAWILFRQRALEQGSSATDLRRLSDEVDELRAELHSVHSDISDLTERIDFTERLLAPGDESDGGREESGAEP